MYMAFRTFIKQRNIVRNIAGIYFDGTWVKLFSNEVLSQVWKNVQMAITRFFPHMNFYFSLIRQANRVVQIITNVLKVFFVFI